MKTYLVGGAVRDQLLGRAVKERDYVVVGATPEQMQAQGYQAVGKDFPVFLHPETKEEYALARTERKTGPGYTGFTFHAAPDVTLEQDLKRRDLTINAIAQDSDGRLFDPYNGQQDIQNRVLRHVSHAFVEDPVRILRLARFAARFHDLGFTIAPNTLQLMQTMVAQGEVDALVAERVWQEMQRALSEKHPEVFFETLRACGALSIILPEVDRLWGVPQSKHVHPEVDTGVHVMLVLQQAAQLSDDTAVRFAALMHDLGKGTTDEKYLPRHPEHEARGVPIVEGICERLRIPNHYRDIAVLVTRYHGVAYKTLEQTPVDADAVLTLLEHLDVFRRPERLAQFILACQADVRGRPGYENDNLPGQDLFQEAYNAAQKVSVKDLNIDNLPGPAIKQALRTARIAAIESINQ